ncbi:CRTAC1 family protein [uncultured Sulfitobacter sp.]|uniref:CRTAC1 family protein n=1 Tax=uncultured Sulfitobacter sp. TaxID=191468 RepID=UPI002622741C|nr:CRTAC1 family protein [uncultured Sulfitobacter sp.]
MWHRLLCCLWAAPVYAQSFTPIGVPDHVYEGGWEHFVGGGIAAFDCDGDTLPELYAAGGTASAKLFRNTSTAQISFRVETPDALALTGVTGAYPLDFDNDGQTDLAVLRVGENKLLRGLGDCQFTQVALPTSDRWTTSFSATWEGANTRPTLVFGNYVDRSDPDGPFKACDAHELYRPAHATYKEPDLLTVGFCTLSMLFTDWARAGRQDLRVSNDRHYYVRGGQEQLWAMEPTPRLFGPEDGWLKHELWGMGIASRDVSGDGLPDVYLTSMGDQRLQLREGEGPTYRDASYSFGVTAHMPYEGGDGRPSTGWHAVFGDVQNDGLDDLFVTKGNVDQMPGSAFDDPNNLLVQTPTGFIERGSSAGLLSMARSRGAALVDLNRNGLLDVAVVNRRAPLEVWQNTTTQAGNFVTIAPIQAAPNRNAVGAWIELKVANKTVAREITIGGGHAGGVLVPEHFGLGQAQTVQARIIWPDREISEWVTLLANTHTTLTREGGGLLIDF